MKQFNLKKCAGIFAILCIVAAGMLVLTHPAKNGRATTTCLPTIPDSPVYVECQQGETLTVELTMKEAMDISGLQLLLVNISEESRGDLLVSMKDEAQNVLLSQTIPVNTLGAGDWFTVSGDASLTAGATYTVSITADGSEPYFMKVSPAGITSLPFEETVMKNGKVIEDKISMGMNQVVPVEMTYGDIFYYSIPVLLLCALAGILLVIFGKKKLQTVLNKIPFGSFLNKWGNELFLILLFVYSAMGIYSEGYVKSVFITSDSAGYLREAVNLAAGNGFYYDGLAGYDNWFANWPIIYPLLIAGVMAVTGVNAYLASKIVSMLMVALILIVLRIFYKKDAWFYALCVWNLGFVTLTHYTWSEVPFIFFLLLFVIVFGKVITSEKIVAGQYVLLGVLGLLCFLTRYFGIYVWMVTGLYILYYGYLYFNKKNEAYRKHSSNLCNASDCGQISKNDDEPRTSDKNSEYRIYFYKAAALTITAFVSGMLSIFYMLMNKMMNGHASGVSRTLWWDDYEILTNDLIQSLLTEITNVFGMQIPDFINAYPYNIKLLLLFVLIAFLFIFIVKNCRWQSAEGVLITFGLCYYVIFIAIRYVSSMDTFYFRFFEPASFIICLGLMGLLLPYIKGKAGMKYFAAIITVFLILSMGTTLQNQELNGENAYYHVLTAKWQEDYKEIPQRSVVIFSDLDYRSSYFRPDVISGEIRPEYSFEEVRAMYEGSDYLCIKKEFAEAMLESGEYEATMAAKLKDALKELQDNQEYAIILLRF